MNKAKRINRRRFLAQTGAAAAPLAVSPSVLGLAGTVAPSERITIGCVGTGERGRADMAAFLNQPDAQIVAVCDVKRDQRELAARMVKRRRGSRACSLYADFRELLARTDIDAALIATPDHWHVPIAIAAVSAGKDIYLEKPMSRSLEEDQELRAAVHRTGRIFQFGTQQRSALQFRQACELVRNGRLGKLTAINVWAPGSAPGGSTRRVPPPEGLDYDFWLGPARYTPYTENKCSNRFSKKTWWYMSDYTLGFISGWGIHPLDIAWWGAAPWMTGPVEIDGAGEFPKVGACDTATTWEVRFRFASGLRMTFLGVPNPDRGEASHPWKERYGPTQSHGTAFEGTEGWARVDRGGIRAHPEALLEEKIGPAGVRLPRSSNHVRNFLDAVKTRGSTVCPIDEAFEADALCQISEIAVRLQEKLIWDREKERFLNSEEANRRLRCPPYRSPWRLRL